MKLKHEGRTESKINKKNKDDQKTVKGIKTD